MKYRWQISEKLADDQVTKPLRKLLHDQWLLPNRLIHYLRIRRTVLVNGEYRSMNELVGRNDNIQLLFCGDEIRTPAANDYIPSSQSHLEVLYENRDLLVVNKPR